ncbi:hypothetical protein KM043_018756 [Ampulex compressa]|nr:hypothetical protein KM043_018756 [Ampulex compressa]
MEEGGGERWPYRGGWQLGVFGRKVPKMSGDKAPTGSSVGLTISIPGLYYRKFRGAPSSHAGYGDLISAKTYGTRISSWFSNPARTCTLRSLYSAGCAKPPYRRTGETGKQNGCCARHFAEVTNKRWW